MASDAALIEEPVSEAEDDLWAMANLYPRDTGLPLTVWVSAGGRARHDARVKVCMTPGERMDAHNTAVVTLRPEPRLLHGDLTAEQFGAVKQWIELNADILIRYWDGRASTVDLVQGLQRV